VLSRFIELGHRSNAPAFFRLTCERAVFITFKTYLESMIHFALLLLNIQLAPGRVRVRVQFFLINFLI
jgi:hypothetical protein